MLKRVFSVLLWSMVLSKSLFAQDFTWENLGKENRNFSTVLVSIQDSRIIFSAGSGNILKSENAGKDWRRVLTLRSQSSKINDLVMDKLNPNVVYAATDNGLYRSTDLGEHWERVFRGKNYLENQCVSIGVIGQTVLVGTQGGLFVSQDSGRSWYKHKAGIGASGILNIDTGLGRNNIIYLAAQNGIFKSLDQGRSWEKILAGYRSQLSEEEVSGEDEHLASGQSKIRFVRQDKYNPARLYYSSQQGVYLSLNSGHSWQKLTDYGLLDSDIKMLCLSDSLGIVALSASGVFVFKEERWWEISIGLVAQQLNFLALDNTDNIYVAADQGIYKSSQNQPVSLGPTWLLKEYYKNEPDIRSLQQAAIKYAEVSPEKISQWRKAATKKAFLPRINFGLDRNSTDLWHWEGGSTVLSNDDILRRGKDSLDWDISLAWDLSELFWNDAQVSIDVRSKLMVELRNDILDQLNKLYFERLRIKNELDNLAIEDQKKRFQKQLKLEELTAALDSLTGGYYSGQLALLAQNSG